MTEYVREWEDVYRALVNEVLRGIEIALQPFANGLDNFLAELFSGRLPSDWRERWHRFVAEQATLGFLVEPESVEELEAWIEQWAAYCGLLPSGGAADGPSAAGRKPVGSGKASEKFFDDKLALAQRQLDEIQQVLEALGPRLDAAREGESVDVETDVDRVEELIWSYHDALESARAEWLTQDLAGNAMERLQSLHTPASFGLPFHTDEQQAQRAAQQERKINERLRCRNIVMDRLVHGAQAIETTSTVVGFAVGGGLACKAVITGGRWAVVKLAASAAVGAAVEHGLEAAARAAGASEQVIRGTRLAVAIVSYILLKRKGGFAKSDSSSAGKPAAPPNPSQEPFKRPSVAPKGPLKNQSGDLETAAEKARTHPHGQPPPNKTAPHPAEQSNAPIPESRKVKQYPDIEGTPDRPRSKEHVFLQVQVANEIKATGDYVRIAMGKPLSAFSGLRHSPDIHPDIMGVTIDKRIDLFEIISPSQTRKQLVVKLEKAMLQLPQHMRGEVSVIDPGDALK